MGLVDGDTETCLFFEWLETWASSDGMKEDYACCFFFFLVGGGVRMVVFTVQA